MTDYKLGEAALFDQSYKRCVKDLRTPTLAGVAKAFVSNMDRVSCLADFPLDLIDLSVAHAKMATQACLRVYGKPELDKTDLLGESEKKDAFMRELSLLITALRQYC